ncbi:tail fiber protein [Paucibacter sediminis]|uniref:Tail fiber protein n=1 Tax=Paucibacter sediminis TaxID=3019553 RepID=A0AA95SN24_9BURK|nr:tail fiber protein [Paucibacter sp. S2-9]WIT13913.1 tail fiber protein [Paucibacter sp. S2-9]
MGQPYVGEIRMFAGNFAPNGWAFCNGSLLPISENEVLFQLIGTTYGGDGQQTFALPDMRGRVPMHQGTGPGLGSTRQLGELGGSETVTLTSAQMPMHTHALRAATSLASLGSPAGTVLAKTGANSYDTAVPTVPMAAGAIPAAGGSQPHSNMAPYCAVNYIISLFGIFPSQS